jgi:hypothetical protein
MFRQAFIFGLIGAFCVPLVWAQASPTPAAQSPQHSRKPDDSKRMLGVFPQFGVTNQKDPQPLKPSQKFHLFYRSVLDPAEFAVIGLEAGIGQAENSFPEYGQGAAGYGKRYGAAFGDQVSSGFFGNFVYPVMLKQDPRYYRRGEGSFKRRLFYALAQEFVGHKDGGARTFNWPVTLGALTAGGISNAYYPPSDRGFELTMSRAGISLLYGSLGGIGSEFWPDIARKLHRHKKESAPDEQTEKK